MTKKKTVFYPLRKGFNDAMGFYQSRETIETKQKSKMTSYRRDGVRTMSGRMEVILPSSVYNNCLFDMS